MNASGFSGVLALKEHLFSGQPITHIEGFILFGVQKTTAEISRLRKEGYIFKSRRVPYVRALRRINEVATVVPPANLPLKEIKLTEWQISL